MVTGVSDQQEPSTERSKNQEQEDNIDDSQTQIPTQFLPLNPESQEEADESQTQIPSQFLQEPSSDNRVHDNTATTIVPTDTTKTKNTQTAKRPRGRPRKAPIENPAASLPTLPELWCDCSHVYPDAKEIAEALQDLIAEGNEYELPIHQWLQ